MGRQFLQALQFSSLSPSSTHSKGKSMTEIITHTSTHARGVVVPAQASARRAGRAPQRKKQAGIALVSWLLAGVLAAIAMGSLYVVFGDSGGQELVETSVSDTRRIFANAQKNYGAQNLYANVTTANAVQNGLIPQDLRDAGANTARNKFNGAITVTPTTCSVANDCLIIGNANVPRSRCSDFVMSLGQSARRVQVGGVDVKPLDGAMNVGTLGTQCDAAATSLVNTYIGRFAAAI
jgi:hypothetical protein